MIHHLTIKNIFIKSEETQKNTSMSRNAYTGNLFLSGTFYPRIINKLNVTWYTW